MKIIVTIVLATLQIYCFAQSYWIEDRKPHPIIENETEYALQYLYYAIHYDYKYDQDNNFSCDLTYHTIARPHNDDGLESINKIYISLGEGSELIDIKARVFTKDGSIVSLDQNNIKEVEDEEAEKGYKIFAVEGAEVGSEIEYRYVKRGTGSTFINENIQFSSPIKSVDFVLTCPENLEFEFLVANDSSEVVQIDTTDQYNRYQVRIEDVPEFQNEAFSGGNANKKRIDFRLAYNSVHGKGRINTYSDAGKRVYDQAHNMTKDEEKLVSSFLKDNDLKISDPLVRLKHLEHAVKTKYYWDEYASDNLEYMFQNNFGGKRAFLKLFVAIAESLDLDYEIVVTTDRFESKFDQTFDSWNYLDDYLMYFPNENKFLSVHDFAERFGSVSPENTETLGLFIRPELITDYVFPVTRVDFIPAAGYSRNMDNMLVNVRFDDALSKAIVNTERSYLGYQANYYKSSLFWLDEEQKKEMLNELANYLSPSGEILDVTIKHANTEAEEWHLPFIVDCSYEAGSFIEQAGSSILFKVGDLIGQQSELYQEEARVFPIENTTNRGYIREIVVEIPEQYEIQNLDDIVINEKVGKDNPIYVFESSYEMGGRELRIRIDEYYDQIFYSKENFEEFRRVINAAADWNKIILVLKPV